MKNFVAFIFASLLSNAAFATSIVPVAAEVCTRDFNAWGVANSCECPTETAYDARLGQCVQGAPIDFAVNGMIATEFAITGKATVPVLHTIEGQEYELILSREMAAQIESLETNGFEYRVAGEILEGDVSNPTARSVVIVNSIDAVNASYHTFGQP